MFNFFKQLLEGTDVPKTRMRITAYKNNQGGKFYRAAIQKQVNGHWDTILLTSIEDRYTSVDHLKTELAHFSKIVDEVIVKENA